MPVNIKGKVYTTVAERINDLAEACGGRYSLVTEIVQFDNLIAVMKATITLERAHEEGGWRSQTYTGHAFERSDDKSSLVNKTSHLENAETSAVGRALAAAGFGGGEYASADEVGFAIAAQKSQNARTEDPKQWEPIHTPDESKRTEEPFQAPEGASQARPVDIEDARRMLAGAAHMIKVSYPAYVGRIYDAAEYFGVPYERNAEIHWEQVTDMNRAEQMLHSLGVLRNKLASAGK